MPGLITPAGFETVGYSSRIPGGFAETLVLSDMLMLEVPNGLSSEQAALTEPLAVGEHAVVMGDVGKDQAFMVVGCGPVGLAVTAALKARGLGPVIAVDFSAERRGAAERMGADRIIDPAEVSPHNSWTELGVPATAAEGLIAAYCAGWQVLASGGGALDAVAAWATAPSTLSIFWSRSCRP